MGYGRREIELSGDGAGAHAKVGGPWKRGCRSPGLLGPLHGELDCEGGLLIRAVVTSELLPEG